MAQVSYDLDFQLFGTFYIISKKGIIVEESPEAKHIEKTLLQEYYFSQNFFVKIFVSCKHSKKPGHL
jgi:hypothetical protein